MTSIDLYGLIKRYPFLRKKSMYNEVNQLTQKILRESFEHKKKSFLGLGIFSTEPKPEKIARENMREILEIVKVTKGIAVKYQIVSYFRDLIKRIRKFELKRWSETYTSSLERYVEKNYERIRRNYIRFLRKRKRLALKNLFNEKVVPAVEIIEKLTENKIPLLSYSSLTREKLTEDIKVLQEWFNKLGFEVNVSGQWDEKTEKAYEKIREMYRYVKSHEWGTLDLEKTDNFQKYLKIVGIGEETPGSYCATGAHFLLLERYGLDFSEMAKYSFPDTWQFFLNPVKYGKKQDNGIPLSCRCQ